MDYPFRTEVDGRSGNRYFIRQDSATTRPAVEILEPGALGPVYSGALTLPGKEKLLNDLQTMPLLATMFLWRPDLAMPSHPSIDTRALVAIAIILHPENYRHISMGDHPGMTLACIREADEVLAMLAKYPPGQVPED